MRRRKTQARESPNDVHTVVELSNAGCFTETEISRETVSPERAKAMVEAQAIQRRETPEDLVEVAVFLASEDDSRFITGQVINVDGGLNFY